MQTSLFAAEAMRGPVGPDALAEVREQAQKCRRCQLCEHRKRVVFGEGAADRPALAFVASNPGILEDREGLPLVGPSGALLDQMLEAMGLQRERVFVTNTVLCRPPDNRYPAPAEVEACSGLLMTQLKIVRPGLLVLLGEHVATNLGLVGKLRGTWHAWEGIPVRVIWHPAHLRKHPRFKSEAWADLQAVMRRLGLAVPNKRAAAKQGDRRG